MDRDTCVARVQEKLGFRTDRVTEITNALQDQQDELERGASLPWFLLQQDQTFSITAPNPVTAAPLEVDLPTGFIKESDEKDGDLSYQAITPGPRVWLKKFDLKTAEEYFFSRRVGLYAGNVEIIQTEDTIFTAGAPLAYVIKPTKVRIYPGPDKNYSLLWSYYTHDTRLDGGNVTNQWTTFAPWLLIGRAMRSFAQSARDADGMQVASQILYGDPNMGLRGAEKDFLALCYEREIAGRNYSMGSKL